MIEGLSLEAKRELLALLEEKQRRASQRFFYTLFPAEGELRRELYPRHLRFFELGKEFKTRAFMAGNRVGKTIGGGYETTCHAAGIYPDWWPGVKWNRPVEVWAAGDTMETTRDIIQAKLLGPKDNEGTGLIPGNRITKIQYRPNTGGAADFAIIEREGGGASLIGFKSYDQGRRAFQGTEKDIIWLDEEAPDEGIRAECITRLMTTGGHLIETFTPLKGLTPIVLKYVGESSDVASRETQSEDRVMVMAGWDDVPHLGADEKRRLLAESEPHLREARSKGIPSLGSGAIYPVPEADITVDPFEIPMYWPRAYGLDVGWNKTAAIWGAVDRQSGQVYLYSEHYRGEAEPAIHAQAIKARGAWVPGVVDPAARGRAQKDGQQLMKLYQDQGLDLGIADNSVEAGLQDVWMGLSTGRIKVFKSLKNWLFEYRLYRRDEKGRIVKKNDHAMDATRYLIRSGIAEAKTYRPPAHELAQRLPVYEAGDSYAGY